MATITWMWGDAGIVGHAVAQWNPLRWSSAASIKATLEDLERYETQGVQRSVLMSFTGSVSTWKRRYPNVADAVEFLKNATPSESEANSQGGESSSGRHDSPFILPDSCVVTQKIAPPNCGVESHSDVPSQSVQFPTDEVTSPLITDEGIMQLLLAGGQEALLGQWLQQVIALMSLRPDFVLDAIKDHAFIEAPCDDSDALEACKGIHKALADIIAADQLEEILASEAQLQTAPLVLTFLAEQVGKAEGGLRATLSKDLAILLSVLGWQEVFELRGLTCSLPDDCRYTLASSGILLGSANGASAVLDGAVHQDQVKTIVQEALHQATSSLVDAGARIVILGDRGAGKSSICNAAFGNVVAAAGAGRPVTTGITLYEATEKCPVHIYDTKGFETLSDNSDALSQLKDLVEERKQAVAQYPPDDPVAVKEQLHAIWWVIDVAGGGRFNPESVETVARLFSETGVPIIMVLNKCDVEESYVREVERSVREHCLWANNIVRVVAFPRLGPIAQLCEECGSPDIAINCKSKCYSCETCERKRVPFKGSYGFDELVRVTIQCLPKMVTASFTAAQKVWLEGLDRIALRDICIFGAAAGGMGAAPLPFLTHFALFPLQVTMVVKLASVYGVIFSWKTGVHVVCSLGVVSTVGFLGWTAANVLKLMPGLNTVGMVTDACVSASFTVAIGLVVRTMLRRVRGKAATDDIEVKPEDLAELMSIEERRSLFTAYFNRLRAPLMELMEDASSASVEALELAIVRLDY